MVDTMEEDERRIREKYGDILSDIERENKECDKSSEASCGRGKFNVHFYTPIVWWCIFCLFPFVAYNSFFLGASKLPCWCMMTFFLLYAMRWRIYFSIKWRIKLTLSMVFFIYIWLFSLLQSKIGRIDNALFSCFLAYGYCLLGMPLLAYWTWRKKRDDRVALLAYLGGIGFILVLCLVPNPQRLLIYFCILVGYLAMKLLQYRVREGTFMRYYESRALDSHALVAFILLPLALLYTQQGNKAILLMQLPDAMALYWAVSGVGALEYVLYALTGCGLHLKQQGKKGVK